MNKILIVDDNPKNIQLLGNLLSEAEYEVEYAQNAFEAIDLVKNDMFDLILMDVMMPEMDGYEACRKIKAMDLKADIPLIFITAKTDVESIAQGFECGGVDYISKPFNSVELLVRVKNHIELKSNREKLKDLNLALEKKVEERTKELHASNEKLKEANRELRKLDEAKNHFLHIISHELRTPLNGILGALYLIKEEVETKEMASFLDILDVSVNRLEKFTEIALKITQLKSGKYNLNIANVKLQELIEFSLVKMAGAINEKRVKFNVSKSISDVQIPCDHDLMNLAFTKILENALNHTPVNSKVDINLLEENGSYTVQIKDQGKGFSKEALEKQFELFSTGEEHIDSNMGIDLALANLVIEAHRGVLKIDNDANGGALVSVQLTKTV